MKRQLFFAILCFIILTSFCLQEGGGCHSGIKGHVYLEQGNRMPSPDQSLAPPPGLQTRLYIYELTNLSQVTREGKFYKTISTPMVKSVDTEADGSFKTKLKPGTYSLFVKKDDLFFASIFDGNNNIYPIEVKKGNMTDVVFRVNYDATY
jgi:hypothetical protein